MHGRLSSLAEEEPGALSEQFNIFVNLRATYVGLHVKFKNLTN
jgi:hypothetical protein